jgi:HEAT repeat protein
MRNALLSITAIAALLLSGCKGDPNTPEYWEKAITGAKSKKQRQALVEDMRNSKRTGPQFTAVLNKRLSSGEEKAPEVKEAIARLLGEAKDPASVEPLINALDFGASESHEKAMNKEIAIALGNIGDKKAAGTLIKCLSMKDDYTRIAAIEALGAMKAGEATDKLMELASSDSEPPFVSKKAVMALGDIGDPKAIPVIVRMMFKERNQVSFYMESSYALYQYGQPAADAVLPIIEGKDKELLSWAKESNILEGALYAKVAQVLGDFHDTRAEKAMLDKLKFESDDPRIKYFVRMQMADALGRMRSQAAAKVLAGMVDEEEPNTRNKYIEALKRIGGREAVPALTKSMSKGAWDARERAILGIAMLGDEHEIPALEKLAKDEEGLFTAECKEDEGQGACKDVAASVKKHLEIIASVQKRLEAAKECKGEAGCWAKKLDDSDAGVRERAAYEVGRSKSANYVNDLTKRLTEKNLETRLAIIQGTDWLVSDSKDAAKQASEAIPALEKQIAEEKGKTEFVKVNEDLRRLAVKLHRAPVG